MDRGSPPFRPLRSGAGRSHVHSLGFSPRGFSLRNRKGLVTSEPSLRPMAEGNRARKLGLSIVGAWTLEDPCWEDILATRNFAHFILGKLEKTERRRSILSSQTGTRNGDRPPTYARKN
eukprot:1340969-Amorphochlora_amoeboformis.AAC.1